MAKALTDRMNRKKAEEKQVSLTVMPQGPGSQDIHVEVKENISAKKRRSQKRFAAFLFTVMLLMMIPMARDIFTFFRMRLEYQRLWKSNQELVLTHNQLEEEIEALHSPEMVERLAREGLDMVMPGESKVYPAIPSRDIPQQVTLRSTEVLH